MMIHLVCRPLSEVQSPWLVLPLFEDDGLRDDMRNTAVGELVTRLTAQKEITRSLGEMTALHGVSGFACGSVLIVGLGLRGKFDAGWAFSAGFALSKRLAAKPREKVALALPSGVDPAVRGWVSALVEGVIAGTRGPGLRKTEASRHPFGALDVVISGEETQ